MKKSLYLTILFLAVFAGACSAGSQKAPDPMAELNAPGGCELLTKWMDLHLVAIRNCKVPSHHNRQLSYTAIALYESVVAGNPEYRTLANQLNGYTSVPKAPASREFSWQASANAALATSLRYFYPDNPVTLKRIDSMENACIKQFTAQGISEAAIKAGSQYGVQTANAVIEWSKSDGADRINEPYTPPKGQGLWEPTPPAFRPPINAFMGNCRTLVKGSIDNTLPPPPVAFSEDPQSPFYKMADELYRSSVKKDEGNIATALFWDDFPNGMSVTGGGHWESILKNVMAQLNLSLIEGARVYAGTFITMQDAAIGCFKAKYAYNLLRPVTYIHKYMKHPEWMPLIITPFHPEYPAAHATLSMSVATALTHLLGDNIAFTDDTYAYRKYKARQFKNFKEAGAEAGMSRFYGGIHYKPSIQAGYEQGAKIADYIAQKIVFKQPSQSR